MDQSFAPSRTPIPDWLATRLQNELHPAELLVWAAQPNSRAASRGARLFTLIGGVMLIPMIIMSFFVFAFFGVVLLMMHNLWFAIFLIPFMLIFGSIIAMILFMPLWSRRMAGNTVHALTNQRIITLYKGLLGLQVRSFTRENLTNMQRTEHPDGTGDLIFARIHSQDAEGHHQVQSLGLHGLDRVHDIEKLIRNTLLTPPIQTTP